MPVISRYVRLNWLFKSVQGMTNTIEHSDQVAAKKYPDPIAREPEYFSFLETVLLPELTWKQAC